MDPGLRISFLRLSHYGVRNIGQPCLRTRSSLQCSLPCHHRSICITREVQKGSKRRKVESRQGRSYPMSHISNAPAQGMRRSLCERQSPTVPIELQLFQNVWDRHELSRKILGAPALPSSRISDSYSTFSSFPDGSCEIQTHYIRIPPNLVVDWEELDIPLDELPEKVAWKEIYLQGAEGIAEPTLTLDQLSAEDREAFEERSERPHLDIHDPNHPSKRSLKKQARIAVRKENRKAAIAKTRTQDRALTSDQQHNSTAGESEAELSVHTNEHSSSQTPMTSDSSKPAPQTSPDSSPARHRPLVVGLTKPSTQSGKMASTDAAAALNKEIEKNVRSNTQSAAPADETKAAESSQPKQKKEKAPKQPKPPKAAPAAAPTSPALIDLRVGHILRAISHPNADSLYVSTIAMGDPEGTEHTQVDEETGKVVRTVCSGLNGLIPLAEMQDRKIIVVANLKPVNMRSIKSAAMVLAASPKQEEGADPHAADRVVELVIPPEGSEAGDKVYFEGWSYGEGKGPEKQLNPKKKQWEAIQPGFYTSDDLIVGFDASQSPEVEGSEKGNLVVEGKGVCKVKTLKGAAVR